MRSTLAGEILRVFLPWGGMAGRPVSYTDLTVSFPRKHLEPEVQRLALAVAVACVDGCSYDGLPCPRPTTNDSRRTPSATRPRDHMLSLRSHAALTRACRAPIDQFLLGTASDVREMVRHATTLVGALPSCPVYRVRDNYIMRRNIPKNAHRSGTEMFRIVIVVQPVSIVNM